ncbi:bifunctional Gfo/Idh/MocA family oxidoreductase/class I SAM-dependent methyltransferase [Paenibacillus popilliae]|uniref:Oxidoreductase n=1 Tax=Paenibacillus popilliae ATCC 14706 TaxID=1212764 RepID=M9LRB5_PAEPP|nr:bifunctional Gfo/Idh/MocA family oxidoreductase/class I SAM-dependent methyltransferase [Paenibacillus popilliae]GAC43841.1 oxidoreductase [Paenibacillus popilliae ATCC 14706]
MNGNRRLRTVVCGSRFGQFYLEAVKALADRFELIGLLGQGSERSKQCAERYGIPLYTEVEQLPDDIDIACVVLRSGVMGGSGTELSRKLLARGIHVLQEQPVHHKDLAACLRVARQHGVHYLTGDLYVHLPAVRRFIACANALLGQQQALYIDAACATQVSYPLMHILAEALPSVRPWKINHVIKDAGPFQLASGSIGNIPITLRAHNEVDPDDPDNYLHLLHSLTIGVPSGSLSLIDTHGPVIWRPRLHVPDVQDIPGKLLASAPAHLLEHSAQMLGPTSVDSYRDILLQQWPQAIGRDLLALGDMMQGNAAAAGDTRAQQELLCSRQWQDLTQALGYPVLRSHRGHQPLSVARLQEAALTEIHDLDAGQVSECVERLDAAALSSMLFALQSQGTLTTPEHEYGEADILAAAKVASRHRQIIVRWLQILAERGYLIKRRDCFLGTDLLTKDKVEQRWKSALEAWSGTLGSRKIIDYLITNAEQLPQLMSGEQQAALLLFPEGRMDIAHALYRDTAMSHYLNKSVADAVMRVAAAKQAVSDTFTSQEASLRILEIGAGTGATTDAVVCRLKTTLSNRLKPDYLFTDISPFFITAARERYQDCPWMRYHIVDIDQSLCAQGLQRGSVDIVIAAGMLNNARDTDGVVQGLMECLVPGGVMLITEPVREFTEMLISQAFMMTPPEDDRKNTNTTFMSVQQWRDVFRRAGAQEVTALPDEAHPLAPLGQKLFAVRKGKDAEVQPHFV